MFAVAAVAVAALLLLLDNTTLTYYVNTCTVYAVIEARIVRPYDTTTDVLIDSE